MKIAIQRGHFNLTSPEPLLKLCLDFGRSKCEDYRDKVFGLRAWALLCCREAVAVDYSSSISEICWRLLSHDASDHASDYEHIYRRYSVATSAEELYQVLCLSAQDLGSPILLQNERYSDEELLRQAAPWLWSLFFQDEYFTLEARDIFATTLRPQKTRDIYFKRWKRVCDWFSSKNVSREK
jgi:hypothetical protein